MTERRETTMTDQLMCPQCGSPANLEAWQQELNAILGRIEALERQVELLQAALALAAADPNARKAPRKVVV